jgi:hypothetical protein
MKLPKITLLTLALAGLLGCGDAKTVIPTTELTEAEKQAIKAEDARVAHEESHGKTARKK